MLNQTIPTSSPILLQFSDKLANLCTSTMAEVIKIEEGIEQLNLCHGCLSQDRKTIPLPLGEISQAFRFLLTPETYADQISNKLCWECVALLKRFSKFRSQLLQAQNTLLQMYYLNTNTTSLSTLSKISKLDYDQKYEHILPIEEQSSIEIDAVKSPTVKVEVKREPNNIVLVNEQRMDEMICENNDFDDAGFDSDADDKPLKVKYNETEEKVVKKTKRNKNVPHNFIEHAIIKINNKDWSKKKDTSQYFTDEYLDEHQVEEYVLKLERQQKPRWLIKCKTCKKDYPNKPDYIRHQNLNHREQDAPNTCLLCKNEFPSLEQLQLHWKHTHSCYSRCNMCHMYCKKRGQKKHLNYYHTKLYCCDACGEQLATPKLFNVHYKEKHATFICQLCQRIFHYKRTLIKHMESTHRSLSCKYCHKDFKKAPYLAKHMVAFHAEALNIPRDNESAYCVECDRNFISVTRLKEHLKYSVKHAPPKPPKSIPCPECGKIFSRKTYMKNHYNCAHAKAQHVCSYCCKYFVTSGSLKRHYDEVHLKLPKVKDKICDFCGEGFAEKRTLMKHCRRAHAFVLE